jgi:hypothetical protein
LVRRLRSSQSEPLVAKLVVNTTPSLTELLVSEQGETVKIS